MLSPADLATIFAALGVLLGTASALGELARRLHQPAVVGEILAGLLLGPTVLGALVPATQATLFPAAGPAATVVSGLGTVGVALFLLVAGLEVDLSTVWRQGRTALWVSVTGMVVPFAVALAGAWWLPGLFGHEPGQNPTVFALFFATAIAISALPVIAKILMDLDLLRTDLGMVVVTSAIFQDLIGWLVFAVLLSQMNPGSGLPVGWTVALTLGFAVVMLTVVRAAVHRILPWLMAQTGGQRGVLSFAVTLALLAAAATEQMGVHAIFGAFLAGVALGESRHLRERARATLDQFISFIFAPLFFAGIGLRLDFQAHFDARLVITVLVLATATKVLACRLGARLGGTAPAEASAIGWAMNARGAMEIILGVLALQAGIIGERLFLALVVMALVTSILSGPMVQRTLGRPRVRRFVELVPVGGFVPRLQGATSQDVLRELSEVAAPAVGRSAAEILAAVYAREALMPTGLEAGLAIPHARLPGLAGPCVVAGVSAPGVDFDAPDGGPAHLVFLILTPDPDEEGVQLRVLADIASTFHSERIRQLAQASASVTELRAAVLGGD